GRPQPVPDVHRQRVPGRDPWRPHRAADDRQDDRGGCHAPLEAPEPAQRHAGRAGAQGRGLVGLEDHLAAGADRLHQPSRMRGSMRPTIMSTSKLMLTMMSASSTTAHCTTGKSWLRMDSTVRVATPGHAKTGSVTRAPPSSWPNASTSTVMPGVLALRKPCLSTRVLLPRPGPPT